MHRVYGPNHQNNKCLLTDQKGLDLINYMMDYIADDYTQFVIIAMVIPRSTIWFHCLFLSKKICLE